MEEREQPTAAELTERAEQYLRNSTLSPAEYESIKQAVVEITFLFTNDRPYFILGSYGTQEIRRLQLVKDRLNRRSGSYAFLMIDIRNEWTNTYVKFRICSDYVDYLIGVAEHNRGGFLVEQGYFTALDAYFEKTHLFKRVYKRTAQSDIDTDVDHERPYSAMQMDIFEMVDEAGRCCEWFTEEALIDCAERLP